MHIFVKSALGALLMGCAATAYAQTSPAQNVKVGDTVRGVLDAREVDAKTGWITDVFNLQGTRGQRVTISLTSTSFDALLHVDRGDEHVGEDDDGGQGFDSRLVLEFPVTGTYQVYVTSSDNDQSGAYTLNVARGGDLEVPAQTTPSSAARGRPSPQAIRVGQTLHGRITAISPLHGDDKPYQPFTFRGTAGQTVTIDLKSDDFDSFLVFKRQGELGDLKTDDDGGNGTDARITFRLPAAGTYEIRAAALDEDDTGAFELLLREGTPALEPDPDGDDDEEGESTPFISAAPAQSTPISVGQTLEGKLETSDPRGSDQTYYDAFRLTGTAGQRVVIRMRAGFDAYLYLTDGAGREIGHDDDTDGTNSEIAITLPSAGTYFILANGVGTSDIGDYTISVTAGGQ